MHRDARNSPQHTPVDWIEDEAGPAEKEVGRAVYERIEKLIKTDPNGTERGYLSHLAESVEEVGGYDGPLTPLSPANGEVAAAVGWTAWPRKSSDARYEIGARDEWEAPVCGFCEHHIDVTCDATIIGGEVLHLVHTGCIPDELRAQPNGGAK